MRGCFTGAIADTDPWLALDFQRAPVLVRWL
jgi:hypothetical protein